MIDASFTGNDIAIVYSKQFYSIIHLRPDGTFGGQSKFDKHDVSIDSISLFQSTLRLKSDGVYYDYNLRIETEEI